MATKNYAELLKGTRQTRRILSAFNDALEVIEAVKEAEDGLAQVKADRAKLQNIFDAEQVRYRTSRQQGEVDLADINADVTSSARKVASMRARIVSDEKIQTGRRQKMLDRFEAAQTTLQAKFDKQKEELEAELTTIRRVILEARAEVAKITGALSGATDGEKEATE